MVECLQLFSLIGQYYFDLSGHISHLDVVMHVAVEAGNEIFGAVNYAVTCMGCLKSTMTLGRKLWIRSCLLSSLSQPISYPVLWQSSLETRKSLTCKVSQVMFD